MTRDETITTFSISYTNDKVIINYLNHLIKHTKAFSLKFWKLFFFDSCITHEFFNFVVKTHKHHIALHVFFSHLIHAIQPLNISVFCLCKYYHNKTVQKVICSFNFKYTIMSFFEIWPLYKNRQWRRIPSKTFFESGMWPVNAKTGIKKCGNKLKALKTIVKKINREQFFQLLYLNILSIVLRIKLLSRSPYLK